MTGTITPIGIGTATLYSRDAVAQAPLYDPNAVPGSANAPIIFEPPAPLTGEVPEVWILATGFDPDWGGCVVYVSSDGSTYASAGTIYRGGRQGILTAPLPAASDPDTGNTLAVDLTESAAQILSGTQADADNYVTLCYCDGELVSYQTATLTSAYHYDLTYLRRGVYGTPVNAHSAAGKFARIGPSDPSLFRYQYPASFIGQTLYIKLPSFNIFGGAAQGLDEVDAFAYSLAGHGLVGGTGYVPPSATPAPAGARRALRTILDDDGEDEEKLPQMRRK
jgi:hypothetical protein